MSDLHTFMGRNYSLDGTIGIEFHLVDADLTMYSWLMLDVILVDAMIYDIPLICTWLLNDGIMGCAINLVLRVLDQNDRILGYLDRTERRLRCSVSHMIVGCTRIIHRPHEVVESVAIEHVWRLAISIILQTSTLGVITVTVSSLILVMLGSSSAPAIKLLPQ